MILVSFFKVSNFICFLNLQEEMMEMQKNQVVFLGQTSISYVPFHPALNGCIPVVFQLVNARVFFFLLFQSEN